MKEYDRQSPDPRLSDPAFRAALLAKVEALIAVLEIARRKVHRNLRVPGCDEARLNRIQENLRHTLAVCRRAQVALVQASARSGALAGPAGGKLRRMSRGEFFEMTSLQEFHRLRDLPPLSAGDLERLDLDELCDQLGREG